MSAEETLLSLLATRAKVTEISRDDHIFRSGIDISSIAFTEFVLNVEEEFDADIDIDDLDASIVTVGQLIDVLMAKLGLA